MRGYGLTVMKGTKPERFEVEILGVLRGTAPGRNGVIMRASGLNLQQSGIIAGMSGSPVYVDGRLVGAVSFGWPWPKEPICGITPIADMEKAHDSPLSLSEPSTSWERIDLAAILDPRRSPQMVFDPARVTPPERTAPFDIPLPLVMPALTDEARAVAQKLFPPDRFIFAEGAAGSSPPAAGQAPVAFEPGGSLFAALVTGDMTMGAIGTVTDVRGTDVFGFGHPFLNRDGIAIPMYTAQVYAIFSSTNRSFKIAAPLAEGGAIVRDRATGIFGVAGQKPRTVPMRVTIRRGGGTTTFNYKVFDHFSMTPQLAATVAAASITTLGDLSPNSTLSYSLGVSFSSGPKLDFKWKSAGPGAVSSISSDLSSLLAVTMLNPLERLDPGEINIDVDVDPRDASAVIESVTVRENEVRPGGVLHVTVTVKPALSPRETVSIDLPVPANMLLGEKTLIVSDARTSDAIDIQENRRLMTPSTIDELLKTIVPHRNPGEVVARLADVDQGVAVASSDFPRLPSSALAILAAPETGALSPLYYSVTASAVTPYAVTGKSVIPVRISMRQE
jgi:hypothetical protein